MKTRLEEVLERRKLLITESAIERERIARCAERVGHFFSGNLFGRAITSSAGTVAGLFILRWAARKLVEMVGKRFGWHAVRTATGLWRRGLTRK